MSRSVRTSHPPPRRTVSIRLAGAADIATMAVCGARFVAMTGCADLLPQGADEIAAAIDRLMTVPGVRIWLAEAGGVVGGLGMIIGPSLWRPSSLHAEELFFWVEPSAPATAALRLLRAARADMRSSGVRTQTFFALPTSPPTIRRLYATLGLRPVQVAYSGFVAAAERPAAPAPDAEEIA
jgi:hypothetical protein